MPLVGTGTVALAVVCQPSLRDLVLVISGARPSASSASTHRPFALRVPSTDCAADVATGSWLFCFLLSGAPFSLTLQYNDILTIKKTESV